MAVGAALTRRTEARREIDCAKEDLDLLRQRGGRLVTPDDDEWPVLSFMSFGGAPVREKPEGRAPLVLWAVGPLRLDEVTERAVAIVGTRAATAYGEHVAADLSAGLCEEDVVVVSGGAYGIDGAAHRSALAAEGATVAVLAGGVDILYPAGHSALLHRISGNGLLVSEYPPGIRPARHRFLTRNRLVAALSRSDGRGRGGHPQWRRQHRRVGTGARTGGVRCSGSGDVVCLDRAVMRFCRRGPNW